MSFSYFDFKYHPAGICQSLISARLSRRMAGGVTFAQDRVYMVATVFLK